MTDRIHHLSFLVRDLARAKARWAALLGRNDFIDERLPQRGVMTSRCRLGDCWLILVEPTDPDGVPGRRLASHGEGIFLVSLETGDLDAEQSRLSALGYGLGPARTGVGEWQVRDVELQDSGWPTIQFCEPPI